MLQVLFGGLVVIDGIVTVTGIIIYVLWFLTLLASERQVTFGRHP